ncbi:MAG: hypothetical protein M1840_000856 [Geoglossum simile]|nr:MAG: hypothetical protein M1840_000856 [Geoglossum simile]
MALPAQAEAVRQGVSSASTCSSAMVSLLNGLLNAKLPPATVEAIREPRGKPAKTARPKTGTLKVASKAAKVTVLEIPDAQSAELSIRERFGLATEVVNATLRALTEAIKSPPYRKRQPASNEGQSLSKSPSGRDAMPHSVSSNPLQPRSRNQIANPQAKTSRLSRTSSQVEPSGLLAIAECARLGFSCLRSLQAAKAVGTDIPPLQLENGMSALIGKLIALGFEDLAVKEIRILRRRLEVYQGGGGYEPEGGNTRQRDAKLEKETLASCLQFGNIDAGDTVLTLIVATQMQVMKLISSTKKPANIEAALPHLDLNSLYSPANLILKISGNASSAAKAARQLEVLSQIILSLCPSISASEDAQATNPKVYVSPPTTFQLQYLAFEVRLIWWKLSGHQGNLEKEILDPFGRCFGVFVRRAVLEPEEKYLTALTLFNNMVMRFENDGLPFSFDGAPTDASKLPLVNIYKALGFLAQEALLTEDAVRWTKETLGLLYETSASDARRCSCLTRLATLMLRKAGSGPLNGEDFEILANSLEGLTGSLRGDSGELDELLTDVSALRRTAIGYLSRMKVESADKELVETCKSLVFTCLHFFSRYLGNPPSTGSDAKSITKFGQRRNVVRKVALSTIDSVFSVLKTSVSANEICWSTMDATLQDCSVLASRLDIPCGSDHEDIGSTFVKISNIYWAYYLKKRKPSVDYFEAQLLRCLRRSVEAIRHRSQAEKKMGLLAMKLERLGGIYQSQGRLEEARDALIDSIQIHIGNGTLKAVAGAAAKSPLSSVWNGEDDAAALGRVLVTLVKIWFRGQGPPCAGPPFDDLVLPAEERAALLEWQLVATARMLDTNDVTLFCSAVREIGVALVGIYGPDFPIRRARLSVLLLCLAANHPGLLASEFVDCLAGEAASTNFGLASGNDTALSQYQHHLKASISVCLAFRKEHLDVEKLRSAVSLWLGLTDSCDSWLAITEIIDSPDLFLSQLQATIDFFDMKGFGLYRIPALRLLVNVRELQEPVDFEALTKALSALGLQYLRLGYSGKAGLSLAKAQGYMEKVGGSSQAKLQWHLAYAEYLVELGNVDKCGEYLGVAASAAERDPDILKNSKPSATISGRVRVNRLIADASYVYSLLAFEKGFLNEALAHAKRCVKLNYRAWAGMETRINKRGCIPGVLGSDTETDVSVDGPVLVTSTALVPPVMSTVHESLRGSTFWTLVMPLYRSLFQLSSLYAHQGLFQEAVYYSEQGLKIANAVQATYLISHNLAVSGDQWTRSGNLGKGKELLSKAMSLRAQLGKNKDDVNLLYWLGNLYRLQGCRSEEVTAYGDAQKVLEELMASTLTNRLETCSGSSTECGLETSLSKLSLKKSVGTRETTTHNVRQTSTRAKKAAAPGNTTKEPAKRPHASGNECFHLLRLKANLARQIASTMMLQNNCEIAASLLSDARTFSTSRHDVIQQHLGDAKYLLLQAIDEMSADAVFCVLQDSTISFPAVENTSRSAGKQILDRSPGKPSRLSPRKQPSGISSKAVSKLRLSTDFVDILRQARDSISEVLAMAVQLCSTPTIHKITSVLSGIVMLLSAASPVKGKGSAHPHLATYSMEISRSISLQRQRGAIGVDRLAQESLRWPSLDANDSVKGASFSDVSQFQKEYIDIIPSTWTVISVSLSENRDELYISKLQAGLSPFVLRLPLCRHNSRDADEEVFNFSQGHAELCDIIDLANLSTRGARDMTRSGAKSEWWAEREALDERLKDLLQNIENIWLGGFRGIFYQFPRQSELLSRFRSSFQKILDKHLPSRQKMGNKNRIGCLNLDPRILELFVGLGNPEEAGCDFDEPLTDLLYFVVDVLQFHGERNAYDEIDFDAIAVETQDALRCYHETARAESVAHDAGHTILILDKSLHVFPWESLPCLEGVPVSRMPSIACLRDRILAQKRDMESRKLEGFYINRGNGAYVLNPAGDLKATQAAFEVELKTLPNWASVTQRNPTEAEMKSFLESRDLFLYFGHGSGAQYIRSRTIKKLDKCAVALLMGCSSGALTDVGEFEPYGTPINYAHAGCPALLATLWDVTDKDIDRFSHALFAHWGLFPQPAKPQHHPKTPSRRNNNRSKRRDQPVPLSFPPSTTTTTATATTTAPTSLVEAVAKSRDACILRYLNGAAPVVYGVPVYFST